MNEEIIYLLLFIASVAIILQEYVLHRVLKEMSELQDMIVNAQKYNDKKHRQRECEIKLLQGKIDGVGLVANSAGTYADSLAQAFTSSLKKQKNYNRSYSKAIRRVANMSRKKADK